MILFHYQQRFLPRLFSLCSSNVASLHSNLLMVSFPSRLFYSSSAIAAVETNKYHVDALDQLQLDASPDQLVSDKPRIGIPLENLFVPPEVEPPASASAASGRILKGSNIVLGHYAKDTQVSTAEFVKSSTCTEDCPPTASRSSPS
ncbi:hypothetical protein HPP92_007722 [Vanilla planifolia]|uniref:Uncharacterized protein n=1 Tax=Vanilla planifolia TaxID=51239 RepID=A0A835RKS4_VANPL|nr:hypothetical protein HPP92_007722 [Vanilla planifolia]